MPASPQVTASPEGGSSSSHSSPSCVPVMSWHLQQESLFHGKLLRSSSVPNRVSQIAHSVGFPEGQALGVLAAVPVKEKIKTKTKTNKNKTENNRVPKTKLTQFEKILNKNKNNFSFTFKN